MRPKASIVLSVAVPCLFISLQTVAAQKDQKEISPLNVAGQFSTTLGGDCKSGRGLVVQFHYAGSRALRGYLVTLALADSQTGKVLTEQTLQEARDSRGPTIVDGADWTRTSCSIVETIPGHALNVIAKVDVLKFADGSIWGPVSLTASNRLIGTVDGMAKFNWFKEGFTRYYGYRLVYLAGLMPLSAYIQSLNRDLRRYPGTDDPYIRGRGIAIWLDGEIRKESNGKKSLDSVMLDMVAGSDKSITLERILQTADRYLSPPAQRQLEAAAKEGVVLLPPADAALPGCNALSVGMEQLPVFDLGFDLNASRLAQKVIGVKEDGPAYMAGLRDGQELRHVSIYNGQPDQLAKFSVDVAGELTVIQYYPRGKTVSVPQYHLDSAALSTDPGSCLPR